jgi:hypothetical protein
MEGLIGALGDALRAEISGTGPPATLRGTKPSPDADVPLTGHVSRASKPLPKGIVPDAKYPGMYRLVLPGGALSDMVNLTRAKDALCLNKEGRHETGY